MHAVTAAAVGRAEPVMTQVPDFLLLRRRIATRHARKVDLAMSTSRRLASFLFLAIILFHAWMMDPHQATNPSMLRA